MEKEQKDIEFASEELDDKELDDEKVEEKVHSLKTKRLPDLDKDDTIVRAIISLPKRTYKKLGELALEQEVSRASIIREALKDYFQKLEKNPPITVPAEKNPEPKIEHEVIQDLINRCKTFYGGFETLGENGFFELAQQEGIKLQDLTTGQFLTICNCLKTGYDGFISAPSIEEFLEFVDNLKPTEDQRELLKLTLEHSLVWEYTEPREGEEEESLKETIERAKAHIEEKQESRFPELI
jgi:hypothetical protein